MTRQPDSRVRCSLRPLALLVRTRHSMRAYIWDALQPFFLVLIAAGSLFSFFVKPDVVPLVLLFLFAKQTHVRVSLDGVVVTQWWLCFPYRQHRWSPRGHLAENGGGTAAATKPP